MTFFLFVAAMVLAVWAALVDAGHVNVGAAFQLLAAAIACIAAAGAVAAVPGIKR